MSHSNIMSRTRYNSTKIDTAGRGHCFGEVCNDGDLWLFIRSTLFQMMFGVDNFRQVLILNLVQEGSSSPLSHWKIITSREKQLQEHSVGYRYYPVLDKMGVIENFQWESDNDTFAL